MAANIPPLIAPYLSLPPESSLILLTSVLGASTNWLVLRYLYSVFLTAPDVDPKIGNRVVLVSFLRDLTFWKDGSKRLGLDLTKLVTQRRFGFVDGLSELFLPPTTRSTGGDGEVSMLRSTELKDVYRDIVALVESLDNDFENCAKSKLVLIIDGLDLLLAAAGTGFSTVSLGEMVLGLREHVHAVILTLSDDSPLVFKQETPLEVGHAAFLTAMAHQADLILNLRLLDTGTARDVSGVIRVVVREELEKEDGQPMTEGKELLYFASGDGQVKVFERGR